MRSRMCSPGLEEPLLAPGCWWPSPAQGGELPRPRAPICCWQLPRETGFFPFCWLCTWSPSLPRLVSAAGGVCVLSPFLGPSCARTVAWLWLPVNLHQSTCFLAAGLLPTSRSLPFPGHRARASQSGAASSLLLLCSGW